MEEDRYTRITLRIPRDLHARLQAEADKKSTSQNAEIVQRLEASFVNPSQEIASLRVLQDYRNLADSLLKYLLTPHVPGVAVEQLTPLAEALKRAAEGALEITSRDQVA